jgi:capsular polysaccharide biosynthesis protein
MKKDKNIRKKRLSINSQIIKYLVAEDSKFVLAFFFVLGLTKKKYRQIKMFEIEWLDQNKKNLVKTLELKENSFSYGPSVKGVQHVTPVSLSEINMYCFEQASISAYSSSILLKNKIIIERVAGVDSKRFCFSSGHIVAHGQKLAYIKKRSPLHIKCGIFLAGNGSSNYYHWMIEILPKLKYLNHISNEYADFPILVSQDVAHIANFRAALEYIAPGKAVIILDNAETYFVQKLVYINAPSILPFNIRGCEKMYVSDFLIRSSSVNFIREAFRSPMKNKCSEKKERIFLARKSERRNYNQDEVFELFKRYGFKKVYMEEIDLWEQSVLMSNAEMIAGPTGASWTNLIFCNAGVKAICWMAEELSGFSAFSNLAHIAGVDLRYVVFKTGEIYLANHYQLSYNLKIEDVEKEFLNLCSK